MALGKDKKRITAYVKASTKDAIKTVKGSEGSIAGKILDDHFSKTDDRWGNLSKLSNQCAKSYFEKGNQ